MTTKPTSPSKARLLLPLAWWPERDQADWQQALARHSLLDRDAYLARLRSSAVRNIELGYSRWLAWLLAEEQLDETCSPAERVTPERIAAYMAVLGASGRPSTVLTRIAKLRDALMALAPLEDWSWLNQIVRCLGRRTPVSSAGSATIVTSPVLWQLGLDLMTDTNLEPPSTRSVVQYRDGLMITILACRVLRRANLHGMRIGHHLERQGEIYVLNFEGREMKGKRPFEAVLPEVLTSFIEKYLLVYRPYLLDGAEDGGHMWISTKAEPMGESAISVCVSRRTQKHLGQGVSPHRFRHNAVTTIALQDPWHIGMASAILDHRDGRTTTAYYNRAASLEATRSFQAVVSRLMLKKKL